MTMSGKSSKNSSVKPAAKSTPLSSKVNKKVLKTSTVSAKAGRKVGSAASIAADMDEEMDIKKPLFPLSHYVNDRTQLADEMFRTMNKQGRLAAMLPDILKDLPMSELKKLCVQQLEVMSKKRIRSILDGVEMDSSSGTEDSGNDLENDDVVDEEDEDVGSSNPQAADSTGLDDVTEDDKAGGHIEAKPSDEPSDEESFTQTSSEVRESDMLELHPETDGDDNLLDVSADAGERLARMEADGSDSDEEAPEEGELLSTDNDTSSIAKTYLEILELEMRARAIKSLLKSQPVQTAMQ